MTSFEEFDILMTLLHLLQKIDLDSTMESLVKFSLHLENGI